MRHSYEKALDIATQLTVAQISAGAFTQTESGAEAISECFLKIVETIQQKIERMPD